QPRLFVILILGPFLILLLFGVSYQNTFQTLRTAIVVPEENDVQAYVDAFADQQIANIEIVNVTTEKTQALIDLQSRRLDLVMEVPEKIPENIENNQQSVFNFYHQEIDPYEISYVEIIISRLTDRANRQVLIASVEQSKALAQTYQTEVHTLAQAEAQMKEGFAPDSATNPQIMNPNRNATILWFLLQSLTAEENNPPSSAAETESKSAEAGLE